MMSDTLPKLVLLWTDAVLWLVVAALAYGLWRLRGNPRLQSNWLRVLRDAPSLCSAVVLALFLFVALSDSVHFRRALPTRADAPVSATRIYDAKVESLLDLSLSRLAQTREASYSAPLAWHGFSKESQVVDGLAVRAVARLQFGGAHLAEPLRDWPVDVSMRAISGLLAGLLAAFTCWFLAAAGQGETLLRGFADIARDRTRLPLRAALLTIAVCATLIGPTIALMGHYHVLGTDRTGNDVLLQALKSIRTAFVIGTLATIATLPLAVAFGVLAGYLRGWVDELIQYVYTTLSSVPNVLLIAACVLMMQTLLDQNPEWFDTSAQRSDLRLFMLCAILGLTGWAGLCRLLRAETLKLRELEYVQAAQAFGVGRLRIMARHIFPNLLHLVLISTVLDFSALILYEAVLSYVGVGVDPAMNSFGGMINLARSEMSRDPVVWWSFATAFGFMVTLVLAANLFADGVRDAFDPRGQLFKPSRKALAARVSAVRKQEVAG